jgi:hypothetical protein
MEAICSSELSESVCSLHGVTIWKATVLIITIGEDLRIYKGYSKREYIIGGKARDKETTKKTKT